jgi:cytochrome c oxidase subunit 1
MHGSIMLFLFLGPFAFGLGNYFVPLQVGARDMAFPRLNALSYWFYLFGGITMLIGFLAADGAASFGWTGYTPLSSITRSPGIGGDLWLMAIVLTGLSGVLTAVNIVATVVAMRAPRMRMFRLPIFTWNMLVTSILVLIAFPTVTSAGVMLFADRQFGAHIYDPATHEGVVGSPILVAAPLLVLRPPRGLHPRAAVLRGDHRGPAGVLAPAGVRLRGPGLRARSRSPPCRWACGRTTLS